MSDLDDLSPDKTFAILINQVMAKGIQDGADPDTMARICLNTARELYDHYGAGEEHSGYLTFVTDAQFEQAEIEEWLDTIEGRKWTDKE
jgi:hypothetical protein